MRVTKATQLIAQNKIEEMKVDGCETSTANLSLFLKEQLFTANVLWAIAL
jgi:hypothetical protein